jgi:hypothetical protein
MNLNQYQTSGRTDKSRIDVRQFCAFRGIIAPRGNQVVPSYHRPIAYVDTGNSVCISSVPTDEASEFKTAPIAGVHITALGASPTSVLGGNQFQGNSLGGGFVLNKELSHSIGPTVDPISHVLSFGNTGFTDISQIFHYYSLCSLLFSPAYKLFRRTMQHVLGYGCFVPRHTLQESTGGTRANRLYFGPFSTDTSATMIQSATTNSHSLGVDGVGGSKNSLDSRVNSNNTASRLKFWNFNIVSKNQIPNVVALLKLGVSPLLSWWNSFISKNNWFSPEADTFSFGIGKVSTPNYWHNLLLKLNFMPLLLGSLRLISGRQGTKHGASQLGREFKLATNVTVVFLVKAWNASILCFKHLWGDVVAGSKKRFAELVKLLRLPNFNLDSSYSFHYSYLFFKNTEIPLNIFNYFSATKTKERTAIHPRH